jgi:phage nucleotide-binding protein
VDTFKQCPYKWKLHYIDGLKTVSNQDSNNALYLGNALHKGIETNIEQAVKEYQDHYYIINDNNINEIIKLEIMIQKVKEILKNIKIYKQEYEINIPSFKGYVDLITKNDDGTVDIFDFKYSNAIDKYMESGQLHIYKYYLEKQGFKVKRLGFIFIPKTGIRQKKTESMYQFRKRLVETTTASDVILKEIKFNHAKILDFLMIKTNILSERRFKKSPNELCGWCKYEPYCQKGVNYMNLPSNVRRERKIDTNPDMWIYADSYVGKSTFIDQFNDLLFLNTDGNTDNTTSPVIRLADQITVAGRITTRKLAWEVFLETITELEKKDNTFKRVCIDLVEDLKEYCRTYVFNKNKWEHESDGGFGKGWDLVKTEFFGAIKRLKNLGYQVIYISKEVVSETTLKNGNKLTNISPNIQDKFANVLAGTVDLTMRAYMDGEERYIQLEKKENVFGGGRFDFKEKIIKLNEKEFIKALEEAQAGIKTYNKMEQPKVSRVKKEEPIEVEETPKIEPVENKPHKRTRKESNAPTGNVVQTEATEF